MPAHQPQNRLASEAEACAWADVLLRFGHLHAAVSDSDGHWLIQTRPDSPARLLSDPQAVLNLAAGIQHQQRTRKARTR